MFKKLTAHIKRFFREKEIGNLEMTPFENWLWKVKSKYYYNSWCYFNLYYKHTKKHKEEMRKITEYVLKRRKEAIGW